MTTVEEIECTVSKLPANELARFRAWFEEFEALRFDRKIEWDAKGASSTSLPMRPSPIFATGAPANCEAFCKSGVWESYRRLPDHIRAPADKNSALLKTDPKHPSLHCTRGTCR